METNGTIICRWRIFHCHVSLPEGMIQAFSLSAIRISWGYIGILQIPNFQTNPYFHECYMMLICLKVGRKTSHLSTCWNKFVQIWRVIVPWCGCTPFSVASRHKVLQHVRTHLPTPWQWLSKFHPATFPALSVLIDTSRSFGIWHIELQCSDIFQYVDLLYKI